MFEFHGWATLACQIDGSSEWRLDQEAARVVQKRLDSGVDDLRCAGVSYGNCITSVWYHGQYNHRRSGPLDFLRFLGQHAPGSYGLLYLRETEEGDTFEEMNRFEVWRLARGELQQFDDPFLSPCIPTIEGPGRWLTPPA
ncbi:MAG: Imm7 family immunity protein [Isosphaeraceae bacterium]